MRIDPEDLRRHYASVSDEELLDLDRGELTDVARGMYDAELARRGLRYGQRPPSVADPDPEDEAEWAGTPEFIDSSEDELEVDTGPAPDWLDNAACACTFAVVPGTDYTSYAQAARTALRKAGIPCYVTLNRPEASGSDAPRSEYWVMVPSAFNLHATSVLDRDIFNAKQEEDWRAHLGELSDEELLAQKPELLCAGLLDRVARLKRAYQDEVALRKLKVP